MSFAGSQEFIEDHQRQISMSLYQFDDEFSVVKQKLCFQATDKSFESFRFPKLSNFNDYRHTPHESHNQIEVEKNPQKNIIRTYQKFTSENSKQFWLGYASMMIHKKGKIPCWNRWKKDGFFKKMEDYVKGKNKGQIKSYDQRMKERYWSKSNTNIIDAIPQALAQYNLAPHEQQILHKFQEFKNRLLSKQASKQLEITEKQKKLIQKLQQDINEQKILMRRLDEILQN